MGLVGYKKHMIPYVMWIKNTPQKVDYSDGLLI